MYSNWVFESVSAFVESVDYEGDDDGDPSAGSGFSYTALHVCSRCIQKVFEPYQEICIKLLYFDQICVPILKRCPTKSLCELCTSGKFSDMMKISKDTNKTLVKQLMTIISENGNVISQLHDGSKSSDESEELLLLVLCAYTIVENLYDR